MIIDSILEGRASKTTGGDPRNPSFWVQKLFGGGAETTSGVTVDENNILTLSYVWRAVNLIAGAIGYLPLIVYNTTAEGRDRARGHPLFELLHDEPNPYMDALTFRETLQAHVLLWGNAYAEIERNGAGVPVALWIITPDRVQPEVVDDKLFYKVRIGTTGEVKDVPYDFMLHIKGLGYDGTQGYSVISYARNSIGATMAAEEYSSRFFSNSAVPPLAVTHPGEMPAEQQKRFRDGWEREFKGLDKQHRLAILEEGITIQTIGIPPEDAQLLETRKFSVSQVARWFGVPPHMLADLERATFSNIEHQGIEFVTLTLMPWLKRWEMECNRKIVRPVGMFAEFSTEALLRGDTLSRFRAYQIAVSVGWMNRNEVRQRENLNKADGLDEFLIAVNTSKLDEAENEQPKDDEPQTERFRTLFENTWHRLLTKEINALRRLEDRDDFAERAGVFYDKFAAHITQALGPVFRAYIGDSLPAIEAAERFTASRRDEMTQTELTPKQLVDKWAGNTVPDCVEGGLAYATV